MQNSLTKLDKNSLYKLSLSFGNTLDLSQNCIAFSNALKKYLQQSSCSVWIKSSASSGDFKRISLLGKAILKKELLDKKEDLTKLFQKESFLSFSKDDVVFIKNTTFFKQKKGVYSFFKASPSVFILLQNIKSEVPLSSEIKTQLDPILNKFATSLEACAQNELLSFEKEKNQEIFEELRQYKMMVENISDGIIITDLRSNIIFLNDQLSGMSGYEKEELLGRNTSEIHNYQEHRNEIENKIKRTFKGFHDHYELSFKNKKTGKIWWAEVNVSPFKDKNGKIKGAIGVIRDVTIQKTIESSLKENEWKFRSFFEKTPVGIAVSVTPSSIIVNERFCEMLGYSQKEFTKDLLVNKITHPEDTNLHVEGHRKLMSGELRSFSLQKRYIKKNGSIMWGNLTLSLLKNEKTGSILHLAMVEDIHDSKIMNDTLSFINQLSTPIDSKILFNKIAKKIADTFDIPYVLISEVDPGKNSCTSHAFWKNGKFTDFKYDLKNSPCSDVIAKKSIHYIKKDVQKKYPEYPALKALDVYNYVGTPLFDSENNVIGIIALMGFKKMHNFDLVKRILNIYTTRISGEVIRLKSNQILKNNANKLKEAEKIAKLGSWEYNFATHKIYISEGIYHIFGWKKEDKIPEIADLREAIHIDDRAYLQEVIEKTIRKGKPWSIELRYVLEGKTIHTINNGKASFVNGQMVKLFGTIQDISDKKEAETNLKVATSKYQNLLENINDAVVILDFEQKIVDCNQSAQNILEYEKSEILNKNIRDFIAPEDLPAAEAFVTESKGSGFFRDLETRIITKNNKYKYLKVDSDTIYRDGKMIGTRDIFRDITELKEAEQKRELLYQKVQRANKELKDFAYIVSHDLKAPLRAIGSLAQWISEDYNKVIDQKGKDHLALLNNRVNRMHNFIDGILEYSRLGRIKLEKDLVDINTLIESVLESIETDQVEVIIKSKLPTIKCEKIRIYQVFQNLISNALKYNDKKKGKIKIDYKELPNAHQFSVEDNGPGIDEKYHEKIFQIFQTLQVRDKVESTGIGLTIVKRIVELHGGTINIKSKLGKGAKFEFTLSKN